MNVVGPGEQIPPTPYEVAVAEARAKVGRTTARVFCAEHGGEVGQVRYTPEGPLFCAEVPVEKGTGAARLRTRLRAEAEMRPPPIVYEVRVLIERIAEADDAPLAWCERGQHRLVLTALDFGPHSATLRVKPG